MVNNMRPYIRAGRECGQHRTEIYLDERRSTIQIACCGLDASFPKYAEFDRKPEFYLLSTLIDKPPRLRFVWDTMQRRDFSALVILAVRGTSLSV